MKIKSVLLYLVVTLSFSPFVLVAQLSEARQEALDDFKEADALRVQAYKQATDALAKRWADSEQIKKEALELVQESQKKWLIWRELEADVWSERESGGGHIHYECYQYSREQLTKARTKSLKRLAAGADSGADEDGFQEAKTTLKHVFTLITKQDPEVEAARHQKMEDLWIKAQKGWSSWAEAEAALLALESSTGATNRDMWWKEEMTTLMRQRIATLGNVLGDEFTGKEGVEGANDTAGAIRKMVGDEVTDVGHSIYIGSWGAPQEKGVFILSWLGGDGSPKVRGAYYPDDSNKEIRLYGNNSRQGYIALEGFEKNALVYVGWLNKKIENGRVLWRGGMKEAGLGEEGDHTQVYLHKYAPSQGSENDPGKTSHYRGRLGKHGIQVSLTWKRNGEVYGHYEDKNNGREYPLYGANFANGRVYLDESNPYIGDNEGLNSARVMLRKTTINGKLTWKGSMYNIDGRVIPMQFSK